METVNSSTCCLLLFYSAVCLGAKKHGAKIRGYFGSIGNETLTACYLIN